MLSYILGIFFLYHGERCVTLDLFQRTVLLAHGYPWQYMDRLVSAHGVSLKLPHSATIKYAGLVRKVSFLRIHRVLSKSCQLMLVCPNQTRISVSTEAFVV